jgi:hypothetical protein
MSTTQNTTRTEVSNETTEKKYQDKDWLEYQYRDKGRTMAEMAEIADCGVGTIYRWISKFDLRKPKCAYYRTQTQGYEEWQCSTGSTDSVTVHRLLATLKVDDLKELDGKHVHHKSHIPWLNTLDGIDVLTPTEHREHHRSDEKPEIPI